MRLIDADALETRLKNECREWEGESAYQAGLCASAVIVAEAPTVKQEPSGWISVKDRLPEDGVWVLVWEKKCFVYPDKLVSGVWKIGANNGAIITHWIPMLEMPEEEHHDGN